MAYIHKLIKSLSPDELKSLSALPMQDREREVFDLLCSLDKKVFPSLRIARQLQLNASHLDKINSMLLKKALEHFADNDIFLQINYLGTKIGQWHLSMHLLKNYEQKQLKHVDDRKEKLKFYHFWLEWIISIPTSQQDLKEIESIAAKVLEYTPADEKKLAELWIDIVFLRRKALIAFSKMTSTVEPDRSMIIGGLEELMDRAIALNSQLMLFKLQLFALSAHNINGDFEKSRQAANKAIELLEKYPHLFDMNDHLLTEWLIASIDLHAGNFEDSCVKYHQIAVQINEQPRGRWFIFYSEHFIGCLITGNMKSAEKLAFEYFNQFTGDENGTLFLSACMEMTKYYLFTSRFDEAKQMIANIRRHMLKTTPLQIQIILKELQLAHAYLTGDIKGAIEIANKNLKFMRIKQLHHNRPLFTYHDRLVKPIAKFKQSGHPLSEKDQQMFDELMHGIRAHWGVLLKRWMFEK